jgi:Ca-activated chloride channel family protein
MSFRFAHAWALLLLVLPLAAMAAWRWGYWRPEQTYLRYSDIRLTSGLGDGWRARWRWLPDALRMAAWTLLVLALARPQSGQGQEIIRGEGVDIVLALDISGSMAALDFVPQNRLEAAKTVIGQFISGRAFDRIGLVVFAADAFHQTPPTLDYATLLRSVENVRLATDLELTDGTAIGMGIASAANMLRQSAALSKVIILLTDGANNAGSIGPITAAQAAAALDIHVYTIGVGTTELVAMPDGSDGTRQTDTQLDEGTLQGIAATTGGLYFRAQDMDDLQAIYSEIDRLERSDVARQIYVDWQDLALTLVWMGAALMVVERFLRIRVFAVTV